MKYNNYIGMTKTSYPLPPSHRSFSFGKVTISSDFDSGNCSHAQKNGPNSYSVWINPDHQSNKYRVWFYFSIEGIPSNTAVTFWIKNMMNYSKMLLDGLVPVWRLEGQKQWRSISHKINTNNISYDQGDMEWSFSHTIVTSQRYYFAMFFPWSNDENDQFLREMEQVTFNNENIYFHRTSIVSTLQNRPVEFLTISSNRGLSLKNHNFSDNNLFCYSEKPKYFDCDKKYIIFSARVHPGEVPGSHVMCGVIQFLCGSSKEAELLRDKFIFCVFPILNPDGVARGHFRVDTNGINLNRCYLNPSFQAHPSIYAIKKVIMYCHSNDKYFAFFDLHAQASRRGNFIYGNSSSELSKQLTSCVFPKILSLNSQHFEYESSNFMEKHMYMKDKGDHISKEGCGRVAIFYATKNIQSWTLECSYNCGGFVNKLEAKKKQHQKQQTFDQENIKYELIKQYKASEGKEISHKYEIKTFHNLGKNICESLLDLIEIHPLSRITNPFNRFKSLTNLKLQLAYALIKMSPNRFQHQYRKLFFILDGSENQKIIQRCLKAIYFLLCRGFSLPKLNQFIKGEDNTIIHKAFQRRICSTSNNPRKLTSSLRKDFLTRQIEKKNEKKTQIHIQKITLTELADSTQQIKINPEQIPRTTCSSILERSKTKFSGVKVVEIDKQAYLRGKNRDLQKNCFMGNRYDSQCLITNYSTYKKKDKGKDKNQSVFRKSYHEVFRLEILPKLMNFNKAMLSVSPIKK